MPPPQDTELGKVRLELLHLQYGSTQLPMQDKVLGNLRVNVLILEGGHKAWGADHLYRQCLYRQGHPYCHPFLQMLCQHPRCHNCSSQQHICHQCHHSHRALRQHHRYHHPACHHPTYHHPSCRHPSWHLPRCHHPRCRHYSCHLPSCRHPRCHLPSCHHRRCRHPSCQSRKCHPLPFQLLHRLGYLTLACHMQWPMHRVCRHVLLGTLIGHLDKVTRACNIISLPWQTQYVFLQQSQHCLSNLRQQVGRKWETHLSLGKWATRASKHQQRQKEKQSTSAWLWRKKVNPRRQVVTRRAVVKRQAVVKQRKAKMILLQALKKSLSRIL